MQSVVNWRDQSRSRDDSVVNSVEVDEGRWVHVGVEHAVADSTALSGAWVCEFQALIDTVDEGPDGELSGQVNRVSALSRCAELGVDWLVNGKGGQAWIVDNNLADSGALAVGQNAFNQDAGLDHVVVSAHV